MNLFHLKTLAKMREKGFIYYLRIAVLRFFRDAFPRIISPVLFVPSYILYKLGIRFLPIKYVSAIGHLAIEPDCYLKEEILGIHPHYKAIMLIPEKRAANRHLLSYWREHIKVITSPVMCGMLYPIAMQKIVQYDISPYIMTDKVDGTVLAHSIYAKYSGRLPVLTLRESDRQYGWACLGKLGIPDGAWFVCMHARESGYNPQAYQYSYRNVDIDTYSLAIEAIVERGGWCIRMGDSSMKPLPPMKNVIDYAHHSYRSERMDVFLSGTAKFFLGCASGLYGLADIFGVPSALTNVFPMSERPVGCNDIAIPKLMWTNKDGRYLTFKEVLNHYSGSFHHPDAYYVDAGITLKDNSSEDIKVLTLEILAVAEGTMIYTAEDEYLQEQYRLLFKPGHYSHGACSRVGRDFLHKYKHLL